MWPNMQETSDLVTFTEEILNGKLHFLWSVVFHWALHFFNFFFDISHFLLFLLIVSAHLFGFFFHSAHSSIFFAFFSFLSDLLISSLILIALGIAYTAWVISVKEFLSLRWFAMILLTLFISSLSFTFISISIKILFLL